MSSSPYSYAQLEQFASQGGFPAPLLPVMAAIAIAESGGRGDAVQQGQPYATTGWGLWQITPGNSVPSIAVNAGLLDPVANARAAFVKYSGQGLNAWTTFTRGTYKSFLQRGVPPSAVSGGAPATASTAGFLGIPSASDIINAILSPIADIINYAWWGALILGGAVLIMAGAFLMATEETNAGQVVDRYSGAVRAVSHLPVKG